MDKESLQLQKEIIEKQLELAKMQMARILAIKYKHRNLEITELGKSSR